jgi:hypothetical protein
VDEHDRPWNGRHGFHHPHRAVVVQWNVVHRRKQAHAPELSFGESVPGPIRCVRCRRIEHEEADETRRMAADGDRNGPLVTGDARNQGCAVNAVGVELGGPSIRERLWSRGIVPLQVAE